MDQDPQETIASLRRQLAELEQQQKQQEQPPKKRGRKPKPKPPKKKNGRPIETAKRNVILAHWILLRDKMPRERLKAALADALGIDSVGKYVSDINLMEKSPRWVICPIPELGLVWVTRKAEFRRLRMRARRRLALGIKLDESAPQNDHLAELVYLNELLRGME